MVFHEPLEDPFPLGGRAEIRGQIVVVPGQADFEAHVLGFPGDSAGGVVVVVRFRVRPSDAAVQIRVARRGSERPMRRLVLIDEAERAVLPAPQEVQREVGRDVGDVPGVFLGLAADDEIRIEIDSLPGENFPLVESLGLLAQMPFAAMPVR